MIFTRRRAIIGALSTASLAVITGPTEAVTVLDSTWRAEGGGPGRESEGFGAHVALARQSQFAGVIPLSHAGDEDWGAGSSTWVGNFGSVGYVLTAAHIFERGGSGDQYDYRLPDGSVAECTSITFHPLYNWNDEERAGYDFAIVRLDGPVTQAGSPPRLYGGGQEEGARIVMVGYGSRGIGSTGQHPVFQPSWGKAAAENTVDEMMEAVRPVPQGEDAGNWLRVTLRRESEGASRLDGLLGSGDSGGSTWIRTGGIWAIAGVNANGTGNASYGDHSFFARVSGVRDWISESCPACTLLPRTIDSSHASARQSSGVGVTEPQRLRSSSTSRFLGQMDF